MIKEQHTQLEARLASIDKIAKDVLEDKGRRDTDGVESVRKIEAEEELLRQIVSKMKALALKKQKQLRETRQEVEAKLERGRRAVNIAEQTEIEQREEIEELEGL